MIKTQIFLYSIIIIICLSCQRDAGGTLSLQKAEACMEEYPDSALQILRGIRVNKAMDAETRARHALLFARAMDESGHPLSSDSLIAKAVEYYQHQKGEEVNTARSLYYQGKMYTVVGEMKPAANCFLRALSLLQGRNEDTLKTAIHRQLIQVCQNPAIYDEAVNYSREALKYVCPDNDSISLSRAYDAVAEAFLVNHLPDSAFVYLQKAWNFTSDTLMRMRILGNRYMAHSLKGNYPEAIADLTSLVDWQTRCGKKNEAASTSLLLGAMHRRTGEWQKARMYLKKSIQSGSPNVRVGALRELYVISVQVGKYQDAVHYNNLYLPLKDSLGRVEFKTQLAEIREKYQQEKLLRLYSEERNEKYVVGIIAFIVILILVTLLRGGWMFYRRFRLKSEERLRDAKEKLLSYEYKLNMYDVKLHEQESLLIKFQEDSVAAEELRCSILTLTTEKENLREERDRFRQLYRLPDTSGHWNEEMILNDVNAIRFLMQLRETSVRKETYSKENWEGFMNWVNRIHPGLIDILKQAELSRSEIYLCCLMKYSFTEEQLSLIMGVKEGSIVRYKNRIWNKLKERCVISKFANLDEYIVHF